MRLTSPVFAIAIILSVTILLSGCVASGGNENINAPAVSTATVTPTITATATANPTSTAQPSQEGQGGPVAQEQQFSEWKAPDGSITLQVPEGWSASERQADTCTVNWAVRDAAGTSSAYMTNQVLVFKSQDARTIYKQYGLTGADGAPVSAYLTVEQAVPQIIAPLSGATDVQIFYTYAAETREFSQAVCISGLAACDAQVFEAAYHNNGTLMRGFYLIQTYDFGDGSTWWINVWGYTSPADKWNATKATLETTFTSVKYTDAWASNCTGGTTQPASIINQVIKDRQAATDSAAQAWDEYILS